jgi:tetratricopeptide (TPR) repeat protein
MPAEMRGWTREAAISDMKYVIDNTTPDFVLLPEIYTKMGEVQLLLNRPSEAYEAFGRARSLKPNYWPPYFQWGEYLRKNGKKNEARAVVEEGLGYAPDAKPLQSLLVTLGGDPTKVPPRALKDPPVVPVN